MFSIRHDKNSMKNEIKPTKCGTLEMASHPDKKRKIKNNENGKTKE